MKLIYIEWQDAHTSGGWHDKKALKEFIDDEEFIIKECGWLVKETKKFIVIASALKEDSDYWEEQVLTLHKIPKTWIRKRKVIKL